MSVLSVMIMGEWEVYVSGPRTHLLPHTSFPLSMPPPQCQLPTSEADPEPCFYALP